MGKIGIEIFTGVMVLLIFAFIRRLIKLNPLKKAYDKKKSKVSLNIVKWKKGSELDNQPYISKTKRKE